MDKWWLPDSWLITLTGIKHSRECKSAPLSIRKIHNQLLSKFRFPHWLWCVYQAAIEAFKAALETGHLKSCFDTTVWNESKLKIEGEKRRKCGKEMTMRPVTLPVANWVTDAMDASVFTCAALHAQHLSAESHRLPPVQCRPPTILPLSYSSSLAAAAAAYPPIAFCKLT